MLQRVFAAALVAGGLLGSSHARAAADLGYDPHADLFAQLAAAAAQAQAQDQLVLLIAGGDWCVWCHYLDAFVKSNPDVAEPLYAAFVVVKVYHGDENKNERFFSSWPEAEGYPHFWVFSGDGNLLRSQGTLELEDGAKSYDKRAFLDFIERWRNRAAE